MTLAAKRQALLDELNAFRDPQARLAHVVGRGRAMPALPAELKAEAFAVPGCLARLWLVPDFRDGRCWFRCESDSAVVKGIAGLLCEFYSGHAPAEIVTCEPSFLREAGITQHLTPNRRHGLARVWERIRAFAEAQREAELPGTPTETGGPG